MRPTQVYPLILLVVGGGMFFTNLGAARLWDYDEAVFSEAAREMHERGDWVVPYYNGQLFAHKPPLMYWCQISAYHVLGPTEFAARLWSAVFGLGSMFVTYALGKILLNPRAGFWGGLILGSCLNFALIARAATPDSYLVFFCTLSLLVLVRGTHQIHAVDDSPANAWRPTLPPSWRTYTLAYAVMGVAVLVKGPVGVVLPTAVWGLFLLFEQRFQRMLTEERGANPVLAASENSLRGWRRILRQCIESCSWIGVFHPGYVLKTIWSMRPLTALAAVLLVAGPWYVWVGLRTDGEFLREFFGVHNFGRFSNAMENHRGPIFYYLVAVVLGTFPWSILLAPCILHVIKTVRGRAESRSGLVLLLSWVAVWVGFFSIAGTKLPSYVVPAYPAVALIFAALVEHWLATTSASCRVWLRTGWCVAGFGGIVILIVFPLATRTFLAGELLPGLAGLTLVAGTIVGLALSETGRVKLSLATLGATSAVFCTWLLGFSVLPIDAYQNSSFFADAAQQHSRDSSPHVGSFRYLPPSLVFYNRQPIPSLESASEVATHFENHPQDAFVVTIEERLSEIQEALPADVVVLERSRRFLKPGHIVLLGRTQRATVGGGSTLVGSSPVPSRRK